MSSIVIAVLTTKKIDGLKIYKSYGNFNGRLYYLLNVNTNIFYIIHFVDGNYINFSAIEILMITFFLSVSQQRLKPIYMLNSNSFYGPI